VDFLQVCVCMDRKRESLCVYVLCRPNGKLCSSNYGAKCSTTFTSICDDADCKLFTESHLANNLRYDTIGEFNVDWKAEYSALSSTRSQKKN